MAISFGMLGILLMLDACFIVNFFVLRALRYWTDKTQSHQEEVIKPQGEAVIGDVAFAWLVGSVRLEAMSVRKFPGYRKIPYATGLFSTSFFVCLSCILLAPNLVAETLGISGITLDAEFCVSERFDAGLEDLKADLYNQTNFLEAHEQYTSISYLQELLLNDTDLYGVSPFECTSPNNGDEEVAGSKLRWNLEHNFSGEPFFPNYCQEALESAVEAAQGRKCITEICKCPTLPDSPLFQMIGLADTELCAAEVCIPVPTACPPHEKDHEKLLATNAVKDDYRYLQLLAAEEWRNNMTMAGRLENGEREVQDFIPEEFQTSAVNTADKILHQVDVASYIYIAYSCLAMFFPSPLILFRIPYYISAKRFLFGVQKHYFIAMVVALWWGIEYFQAVWHSPDLWLFVHNVKVGDPCFVDPSYLMKRQNIVGEVCEALMPLEQAFISATYTVLDVWKEVTFFQESCRCSFPNQYTPLFAHNGSDKGALGFNKTFELCGDQGCNTFYNMPSENISYLGNASICYNSTAARRLVLESNPEDDANYQTPDMWAELWIVSGFLATLLIKVAVANFGISLMEMADPFVVSGGEYLWMPNSFGSRRLGSSTNSRSQSTNTLETYDEEGRELPNEMVQAWFKSKQRSLVHIGLSRTVFWGIVVHLCMANLFMSVYQEISSSIEFSQENVPSMYQILEEKDMQVLGASLGTTAVVIVIGVCIVTILYRQTAMAETERRHQGDTDDSSVDEDHV